MDDPSALPGHHHLHDQQNVFQNGGIDPSMLLLDPNPPASRLPAPEPLAFSLSSASSSSNTSHYPAMQPQMPPPMPTSDLKFGRPFTFSEALPYSPFTSISPLETRIIPIPTLASKAASRKLAPLVSQQEFDSLNSTLSGPSSPPSADRNLDDVYQLLSATRFPQFRFKAIPQFAPTEDASTAPGTPGTPATIAATPASPAVSSTRSPVANLMPVSRMVFNKATVPFRYPSPESPGKPSPNGSVTRPSTTSTTKSTPTKKPITKAKESTADRKSITAAAINEKSHARNLTTIEISIPLAPPTHTIETLEEIQTSPTSAGAASPMENGLNGHHGQNGQGLSPPSTIKPLPVEDGSTTPVKILPGSPLPVSKFEEPAAAEKAMLTVDLAPTTTLNPQEYVAVADLQDETAQDVFSDLDQRQRADNAFQELLRLFQDIFEAEVNLERQPGSVPLITKTVDDEPILTDASLRKVQTTIQKAITLGCFVDVPVDDLLHMQRLCDGSLKQAVSLDFTLTSEPTDSEIDEWSVHLRSLDAGLKAARLSLKIMSGGREDRQLYSENIIQTSVDLFRMVMDNVIVPIAELRNSGSTERRFKQLASYKKIISPVFTAAQRLFAGLTSLVSAIDLSEVVINSLEYAASRLIFVENAHTERDSVLGVQAFDGLRLVAMDMLSQIFVKKPSQRRGIFDDILTSLEKLPVGKQSARQFKLADGRSIQPVSALIMRLIQASAGHVADSPKASSETEINLNGGMKDEDDDAEENEVNTTKPSAPPAPVITSEEAAAYEHDLAVSELTDVATGLNNTAYFHAKYVIKFIVQRAQTSSKSADTPYRNLLDLFVEDFTSCLENPDWPAAELLLRLLMAAMFKLTENDKMSAPIKNMALEELGVIGAALARLRSVIHKSAYAAEAAGPDDLDRLLSQLSSAALSDSPPAVEFLSWTGPHRATLEYLEDRSTQDPLLRGAIAYSAADWAARVCRLYGARVEAAAAAAAAKAAAAEGDESSEAANGTGARGDRVHERQNRELGRIAYRLRILIEDGRGVSGNRWFQNVSAAQAKLSHAIVTLRSPLGGSFNDIMNILAMGMGSDQATVRSKSLKSITDVLEIDPSIFDNPSSIVGRLIRECCADSSVLVRDSALGLVSRAITLRPKLEASMIKTIIDRFLDSGVGVRKRAIKVARDVYLRNQSRAIRSDVANGLLHRIQDPDEGVRDLARQTIEEIWVTPFAETAAATAAGTETEASKATLSDHVVLILQTVKAGTIMPILDKVFQAILSPRAKSAAANFEVCKRIVAVMFDLVDNPDTDDPTVPSGRDALQLMMIFAKADPRLFSFEQIRLLKPHIASVKDVQTPEDMAVARAVVIIYRRVLPQLSSVMRSFLDEVRNSLMPSVLSVSRTLLDDVMGCLSVVAVLLKDLTGLVRIVLSALRGIQKEEHLTERDPLFEKKTKRFLRYALIVGMAGKHCDFESELGQFQAQFPGMKATSVSKLMVDILCRFTGLDWPLAIRRIALDAIGLICQSWPRNFVLKNVCDAFHTAFNQKDPTLDVKIMQSLKEFLTKEEQRSETAAETGKSGKAGRGDAVGKAASEVNGAPSKNRQLTVMGGTNHDDVASATTQRFLGNITSIALRSVSEEAFLAAEILGSISRQGLVHPKETGTTMITLETSTMPKMVELAYREHRALHNKYETVLEREYVKAIRAVFEYQRDVIGDTRGATADPFTSKLRHLMDVVKDSKPKNYGRLLLKICSQVDFEPAKLDVSQAVPHHLEFTRFIVENMAFFEFMTTDEVHDVVRNMEHIVHAKGVILVSTIESEIFESKEDEQDASLSITALNGSESTAGLMPSGPQLRYPLDYRRLRQVATGCMVLLLIWEARTYLHRQYGLKRENGKTKGSSRPTKVQGITGDKFWEESSNIMKGLDSQELMVSQCRALVELLRVDSEFKVEDSDMVDDDPTTPSGEEEDGGIDRGRKRKAGGGTTPSGRKKRQRSNSQPRKRGRPRKNPEPEENNEEAGFESF